MRTRNWGVVMYIVAALAAITMPLALTIPAGAAPRLFPQVGHQDLMRVVYTILPDRLINR